MNSANDDHRPKPRYRFCWSCGRQLYGNAHRVRHMKGNEVILHADCAAEMDRAGETDEVRQ